MAAAVGGRGISVLFHRLLIVGGVKTLEVLEETHRE